ncbi:MAG: caspase family protein [Bacteroidetes bacterium]|nr:caspase family protein [Bacteroidota bacterium]MBU1719250.1 caspase family protein [Bacteroidota bacterium]
MPAPFDSLRYSIFNIRCSIFYIFLFFNLISPSKVFSQKQDLLFAINEDTYGLVYVEKSEIAQNSFSLNLEVKWVNTEMEDKHDTSLCLVLYKKDLYFDPAAYLSCTTLEETKKDFLVIKKNATLTFSINRDFPGGEAKFGMKFKYAADSRAATKDKNHLEFMFSQPEELTTSYFIDAAKLEQIVRTPKPVIYDYNFVDPSNNRALDAGEKLNVDFVFRNQGDGVAQNARLNVICTSNQKGISFSEKTFVGNMQPKEDVSATLSLFGGLDLPDGTSNFVAYLYYGTDILVDSQAFSVDTKQMTQAPVVKWSDPSSSFFVTNGESVLLRLAIHSIEKPGSAKLIINGKETDLSTSISKNDGDPDYKYLLEYRAGLVEGLNTIRAEISNAAGTAKSDEITVKFESLKGKRLALIIGNADYEHVGTLANPVNDAKDMSEALKKVGFDVILKENATQKDIKLAIDEFGLLLEEKNYEVALFFYAGHGLQYNNNNYIVPVNAVLGSENDIEYDCVAIGRIIGKMKEAEVQTSFVILDACRNNPFEKKWSSSSGSKGLAYMDAPTNTMIAYSTAPGKVAMDGSGKNGLYTSILLKQVLVPNQHIEQVFKNVRKVVEEQSEGLQTPWEVTSLKGDFYFFR